MAGPVSAQDFGPLREAITADGVRALFHYDPELTPFFCPDCDACYCREHWRCWDVFDDDGWRDSIRGKRPNGHERMLED